MNILLTIIPLFLMITCKNEYTISIDKGVGNLELGKKISSNPYPSHEVEIELNENGEIIYFYILSEKFSTKESVKIGVSMNYISKIYDTPIMENTLFKDQINIGSFGKAVSLSKTVFLDTDNDNTCDKILIAD